MALSFPENTYLIDAARDLIYIPIPKVACTSLKVWFLRSSPGFGIDPDPATWKVNAWLGAEGRRYLLHDLDALRDGRTFRFAFVRNPWSRLVSSYVNRIVGQGVEYRRLMKQRRRGRWYRLDKRLRYYARKRLRGSGWPENAELTFQQFVTDVVAPTPAAEMDPHWRPQSSFFGDHEPDFVGRFETLGEDLEELCAERGFRADLPELNRSHYAETERDGCFADCPPAELRAMAAMPRYRKFYTDDLAREVARIYAPDVDRFGYAF